ncbi:uncharacterized protein V1510DRAFT_360884 [Dipodascopsis tothii]|uniref:uncharacterized protein n=1 Tax=Dipodascopsis tothii TaxID=44089 RepID=UPI0034CFCF5B
MGSGKPGPTAYRRTSSGDLLANSRPASPSSKPGALRSPRSQVFPHRRQASYAASHSLHSSPERRSQSVSSLSDLFDSQSLGPDAHAPPATAFDQAHLLQNLGSHSANLMSHFQTIEMYRKNVKKANDPDLQFQFAQFMINAALALPDPGADAGARAPAAKPAAPAEPEENMFTVLREDENAPDGDERPTPTDSASSSGARSRQELLKEACAVLRKLADRGYLDGQYLLADAYSSGLFGRLDLRESFVLFVAATKHGHPESTYRAALCYEHGWGTAKNIRKAVQFLRTAASKNHTGAMLKLGMACYYNQLGIAHSQREGIKWLTRAADNANELFPQGPYELASIYETGFEDAIIPDEAYAAQLYVRSADLNYAPAAARLGHVYEYGLLGCPQDPALSVHYYTIAALASDPTAMLALCAWYMVGAEPVLSKNDDEAYEWAKRAAEAGLSKAMYAVGYFSENGIGIERDLVEANLWYVKAAEAGDERAVARLKALREAADPQPKQKGKAPAKRLKAKRGPERDKDKDCVIM